MSFVLKKPANSYTKSLSQLERDLGVDLKITQDGDLQVNNRNDFDLIAGVSNAAQALYLKLSIESGGLPYHPDYGAGLQIGSKTLSAFEIKLNLLRSLVKDNRFQNPNVSVNVEGSTYIIDLRVTLVNTGIEVPLQFSVER